MSDFLAGILSWAVMICILVIIARVIVSWVAPTSRHPAVVYLCRYTDLALDPIRRRLPRTGPVDFSPMVAILILIVVQNLIVRLLVAV